MSYSLQQIGGALAAAREARKLSQRDVAQRAGTTQARISKIENGDTDPKLSTMIELARALELELVFVPTKHLPAVNAIVRQEKHKSMARRGGALLDRMSNLLVQLRQHYPNNEDLRRLDRSTRELKNFRVSEDASGQLEEIVSAVQRVSETPALVATLGAQEKALRALRNRQAHQTHEAPATRRAAYTLDDEDDDE